MFIPSLQKNINFNPITIQQYSDITAANNLYPGLNIGFNIGFINTLLTNCTESNNLTNFDKSIIGLQVYMNEVLEKNIDFNQYDITHPSNKILKKGLYTFDLTLPTIITELDTCEYIIFNNTKNKNTLLLCEISKHIQRIEINDTNLNFPKNTKDRLKILNQIPATVLVECMDYIDNVKQVICKYYSRISDNPNLKYSIQLLVP